MARQITASAERSSACIEEYTRGKADFEQF